MQIYKVIMAENFSNLILDLKPPVREAHRIKSSANVQSWTMRIIISKLLKMENKDKILK